MTLSIVTCWRDAPELIPAYETAAAGAHVVIVDHQSAADNAAALREMARRLGGVYLRDDGAWNFARLNNRGLKRATGQAVIFLNNDISAPDGWVFQAERDCMAGAALYGPSLRPYQMAGKTLLYLEGYCIGGARTTFNALDGWDETYSGGYWEDNDLCFRAVRAGYSLRRCEWPVKHLSNYTSSSTPGAYAFSDANRARLEGRIEQCA